MKIKTACLSLLFLTFLAGCNEQVERSVNNQVRQDFKEATEAFERAKNPLKQTDNDTVSVSSGIWLGDSSVKQEHLDPLPNIYETPRGITFVSKEPQSLLEISGQLHNLTEIPVIVDDRVDQAALKKIKISHTGKLSDLLSDISTDLGLYWHHKNEKITFFKQETKTFTIYSLPTDTAYTSSIGNTDEENLSIQTSANLKEWEEIEAALKAIVQDGQLSISRSTGTVTITAGPSTLQRVGQYVKEQNRRLSKMVAISVRVLQVSLEDENAVGLNLGAVISDSGLTVSKNSFSPLSSLDSVQGMSVAVADSATGSLSNAAGSTALISALARQGKVSLVTSSVVTTRNNRIAPVNNTQTFKYVDSFSTSAQSDTFNTTDFKPEEETIGFSLQLLPNILENGRLLLMFKMSLKELLGFDTQTFGGDGAGEGIVVRMPQIENRSFSQELVLRSGQTLIMTGFEKIRNSDNRLGVGDPDFMGLGGERITGSSRDVLVVVLTPQVLQSPLDPEERLSDQWGTPPF